MKNKIKKSSSLFKINSLNELIDGIDISLSFSLIPFLAFFYFQNLDNRLATILTLLIVSLSFIIRFLVPFIVLKFGNQIILYRKNLFLIVLPIFYLLPIITPNLSSLMYINILLLGISRLAVGFIISLNNNFLSEYYKNTLTSYTNVSYWLTFLIGVFIGISCSIFINQIFSNSELNNWAWKVGYIFPILLSIIFAILNDTNKENLSQKVISKEEFYINFSSKDFVIYFLKNISILIPITYILFFCFNSWLPGTVSPENMFFSEIKLIHILFLFLTCLFSNFIFELIGREKVNTYFCSFVLILSMILFFLVDHKTTYSINFLHFFVAFISSISLNLFFYDIKVFFSKNFFSTIFLCLNIPFLIASLLIPFFVYYLMFYIIDYNVIYLLIFIIFIISSISKKYLTKI